MECTAICSIYRRKREAGSGGSVRERGGGGGTDRTREEKKREHCIRERGGVQNRRKREITEQGGGGGRREDMHGTNVLNLQLLMSRESSDASMVQWLGFCRNLWTHGAWVKFTGSKRICPLDWRHGLYAVRQEAAGVSAASVQTVQLI